MKLSRRNRERAAKKRRMAKDGKPAVSKYAAKTRPQAKGKDNAHDG